MACPVCKLVRVTDEMRKHPSHTTVYAAQRKAASVMAGDDSQFLCADHVDAGDNLDVCLIVRNWIQREAMQCQRRNGARTRTKPRNS